MELAQNLAPVVVGFVSSLLFIFLRWEALYGGRTPAKREWRYANHSEAAAALSSAHPELKIDGEEMKRLAMLHFFGWDIAPGSERQQLVLVRGTENRIFHFS